MTTTAPRPALVDVQTPASLLRDLAADRPEDVSLRVKTRGIWREISWADYWENAETFAHALIASGIEIGDRIAIHSENRPEWVYTDIVHGPVPDQPFD